MRTAMQNLCERWGLSDSEIAQALDISQRVARLARDGSTHADEANQLDGFLTELHHGYGIEEPAAWMAATLVEGWTVTRWDLWTAGRHGLLIENAAGRMTAPAMLDAFDPDWRRTYWTSFKTVETEDGGRSIVGKSYDDVREQMAEGGR